MHWTQEDLDRFNAKKGNSTLTFSVVKSENEQKKVKLPQNNSFALGRMKAGKMNKTESAYAKHLEFLKHTGEVVWYAFEPVNLRLADKCYYRVDFMVMLKSGELQCVEVKGHWQDDALVKIKAAAEKFPFRFISVKLVKGAWETREF